MDDSHSLAIGGKERRFQTFSATEAATESASVIESGLGVNSRLSGQSLLRP